MAANATPIPAAIKNVGLPAVEADYQATIPLLVALREAVQKLQGVETGVDVAAVLEEPLQYTACKLANEINVTTAPTKIPGCILPVKAGGKTYGYRFVVRFRARVSNLDIGVAVARPSGPGVVGVVVGRAS